MARAGVLVRHPSSELPLQRTGLAGAGAGAGAAKRGQRRARALLELQSLAAAEQPSSTLAWQVAVGTIGEHPLRQTLEMASEIVIGNDDDATS
ncbi:hypothetical protein L7F22_063389 [Adiantum nelumboides]|nr:hypothetical protein [Adiantum nelumboides]